jgi:hypothetical protein
MIPPLDDADDAPANVLDGPNAAAATEAVPAT